ncbi:MAG: hypothetical protein V4676_11665 [Bacteroidota bacterium]
MDNLYLYFIALSVAAGLISLKNKLPLTLKVFLVFLCYTLVNELITVKMNGANHWLYNIYNYIRIALLSFIYLKLLVTPILKKIIKGFLISLPAWFAISFFLLDGIHQLHTPTVLAACVAFVFMSTGYLYELLLYPTQENLLRKPFFWISTGILFYFLGNLPYLGSINYLVKKDMKLAMQLYYIVYILNAVMYTLFVVAFVSTWNRRKSSI